MLITAKGTALAGMGGPKLVQIVSWGLEVLAGEYQMEDGTVYTCSIMKCHLTGRKVYAFSKQTL